MSKSTICAIVAAARIGHPTTRITSKAVHGVLTSKLGTGQH